MKHIDTLRNRNILPLFILSIILFQSCDSDNSVDVWDNEIRFSTGAIRLNPHSSLPASGNQLEKGQKIGINIKENATTPTIIYPPNIPYTADGSGALSGDKQYYPQSNNSVLISAYHPYTSGEDIYTFTVESDQRQTVNYFNSDLLFCPEFEQKRTEEHVELIFNHLLSRITYKLVAGNGLNEKDMEGAVVSIPNVKQAVIFDRISGTIEPAESDIIKTGEIIIGKTGAIMPPQELAAEVVLFRIKIIDGKEYSYTNPQNFTLEKGKSYHYNITLNKSGISAKYSLEDWVYNQEDVDTEAGENPNNP